MNSDAPSPKKPSLLDLITYPENEDFNTISKNTGKKIENGLSIVDSLSFTQRNLVSSAHKKRIWMSVNSVEGF